MSRRSLFGFILLNIIVTFVTVFTIINVWTRLAPQPTRQPVSQLFVVVTATPNPNTTPASVQIVTATGQSSPNTIAALNGTPNEAEGTATALAGFGGIPTLDPSLLPTGQTAGITTVQAGTQAATGSATDANGCQTYAIRKGDTLGSIATTFGVPLADLMRANKLTEADATRLQIGQVLTIPLNGCGLATEVPTATPTKFVVPTLLPTVTLAPTASKTQVEIVQVISPGDITSEGVEIRNVSGGVIQMEKWTLSDSNGHTFTFPEYRMFPGGRVTVYTKDGKNTPIVLHWGQSRALWGEPGQMVTLSDAEGSIQAKRGGLGDAPGSDSGSDQSSGADVPTPTESKVM